MPTLGEELRRRREERGTSLNDISEATRIGTRFLKAIESDSFSILPGGIFTRSFIRAYAKQVGMNEEEAISLYQQQITGQPAESQPLTPDQRVRTVPAVEPVRQVTSAEPRSARSEPITFRPAPTRMNWPTIIIAGGIALFIVIIVIALVKQLNRSTATTSQPTAASPAPAPTAEPQAPAPATTQPDQTPPPQPAPSIPSGEPIAVRLEATTDDSSIQYWIDGAPKPTSFILKKGETRDLPAAQNQVKLNIGNRPTIKFKINNRDAVFPEGTALWGAKVTISHDNLQTYFQ
ncbi:MAG TPA: helix-turn-helix transcriptional regulator [Blastocatellia bacterium]|jgi:cytoskeletal protein RodZ